MATQADLRRFLAANRDIREIAVGDLRSLWSSISGSGAMEVREALEDLLPGLVANYGEVSATVAADWYEDLRDQAAPPRRFSAVLADPVDDAAVRANARWAIGPLFAADPDTDGALRRLSSEMERMALAPGRETVDRSVKGDPAKPRYARVPQGASPCAFCRMLASRGAVYGTEQAAGGMNPDAYHPSCECVPTPVWEGRSSLPDGYDQERFAREYRQAVGETGPATNLKEVLSVLRQQQGIS